MKEQFSKVFDGFKNMWGNLSKVMKIVVVGGVSAVILLALGLTIYLNAGKNGYVPLYANPLSQAETMQVYAAIQEEGVTPEINSRGQIMVPQEQKDLFLLNLAGKGYPKSAMPYDTLLNNSNLTMTETEKSQWILYQTQDRLQETIKRISNVDGCDINITVPKESNHVWDANQETASASVTMTMANGAELSPENVMAIKNLVSFSIQNMKPEKVRVIDGKTMLDLEPENDALGTGLDFKRLEYERAIEKQLEDKAKALLVPMYGKDGVSAVATVKLNYDKVKTQEREIIPQDDGKGVITHEEQQYSVDGNVAAGDIVGEQNNTDTPGYANKDATSGTGQVTNFSDSKDYDVSSRVIETESGMAVLQTASISVMVNDSDFTTEKQDRLVQMVAKGVNLQPTFVAVDYYTIADDETSVGGEVTPQNPGAGQIPWLWVGIGGGVFVLVGLLLLLLLLRGKKKKQAEEEKSKEEYDDSLVVLQSEIDEHKRELMENAHAASNTKENAITNEIRDFAQHNPEIAASLIRSMLKEDE